MSSHTGNLRDLVKKTLIAEGMDEATADTTADANLDAATTEMRARVAIRAAQIGGPGLVQGDMEQWVKDNLVP